MSILKTLPKVVEHAKQDEAAPEQEEKIVADYNSYKSPSNNVMTVMKAQNYGNEDEAISESLLAKGKTQEEVNKLFEIATKAREAESKGFTPEQIKQYIDENHTPKKRDLSSFTSEENVSALNRFMSGGGLSPRKKKINEVLSEEAETAKELLNNYRTVKPVLTSTVTDVAASFGHQDSLVVYNQVRDKSRREIIRLMKTKYNVDLVWDNTRGVGEEGWKIINRNGDREDITPDFWDDISQDTGEILGGIGGAALGAKIAPPTIPSKVAGAAIGGLAGAVVGSELDYLRSAIKLDEDMHWEVAGYKALNAFELAVVGEALGYAGTKAIGAGYRGIIRAKDLIADGNTDGAYQALKETAGYTDDQLAEIVAGLERVSGNVAGKNSKEKAITAVALTQSGMQDLVRAASSVDPILNKKVIATINNRAKSVIEATDKLAGGELTPESFKLDLINYVSDVNAVYNQVKVRAEHSKMSDNFSFDMKELAVKPLLEDIKSRISDKTVLDNFVVKFQAINNLTEKRSLADLIELRQLTNDFLYGGKVVKRVKDRDALREVISGIDEKIEKGAYETMENPEQWLKDWEGAKKQYSEMKKTKETSMYNMVFDENGKVREVEPHKVTESMNKYLTTLDGNFNKVLDRLPSAARKRYEGAAIDSLVKKYTLGYKTENQAIHFPALAEDLEKLKLISPEARALKKGVSEIAEVFRNDMPLGAVNSNMSIDAAGSSLTANLFVKAKYEMASKTWSKLKSYNNTKESRVNALVLKTAKLLDNPMEAKLANEFISEFREDPEMLKSIAKMQREAAYMKLRGYDPVSSKVRIYEGGKYQGTGEPVAKIPRQRIASLQTVQDIADQEGIAIHSEFLDDILKQHGVLAVENGTDRVRLLK